ncbi:DUF484 family protein [Limimaricola pyoseonensis]|uniref:Recombinase XerC n=1 Tax=Limimaricola pyoseonensis TaxID=521013 RepID=A0A1G7CI47_9RHOB|nr:DUF484 family protein [Limimaricola pyoseonensis]SDE38921.1 hypothetical protein SAMN04488567_1506 [Limimaricola pyoseonensis]
MTQPKPLDHGLRDRILSDPALLLDDPDIMRALVEADERARGTNVVDLRGLAMKRLETRLDRLEDTHRSVIAAAYENLAGTNQIHRAVLRMMDATQFEVFLRDLSGEVADMLRVDIVRLVLETARPEDDPAIARLSEVLSVAEPGYVADYVTQGRNVPLRQVALRQVAPREPSPYGRQAPEILSEACLKLDFGPGRLPGMLLLGASDADRFTPQQGTDLMGFFAGVFERQMRRWLS